jgi:predicted HAD superfamily phosphohydrolase YqeG
MSNMASPALTPEQWEAKDYRQVARDLDNWAKTQGGAPEDDATEYVAKLGLNGTGSVIVMNRAHDRVLVPPPARAPLAALALAEQSFGFTAADVQAVIQAAERAEDKTAAAGLRDLGQRIQALLPPEAG